MTTPTAFASIAQAVRSILEAQPPLADKVTLQRVRVLPTQQKTALAIRTDSGAPSRVGIFGAPIDWTTTLTVECYAREDGPEALQERLDALLAGVYARILAEPALGGLAMDTQVGQVRWDFDNGEDFLGCATVHLQVLHRTGSNNLSPQ